MKLYCLKYEQTIPVSLQEAWTFFSNPANLAKITPEALSFQVISELPGRVYAGLIVHYTIKPLPFLKLEWVTEITQAQEQQYFVDEQRFGPYKFWHHQHMFEAVSGGTRMQDIVHYGLPFGWLGRFAHWLFVGKQLRSIFSYREQVLRELFVGTAREIEK